jgi:tRNA 2-thiouridine synthesizing protein E
MNEKEVTFKGKKYSLDRHGFLDPPDQWDENFVEGIARTLGIHTGLTEDHWTFIRYLREKFIKEKTVPVVVAACADNKLRLSRLRALFPTGYHRGACRIAGINFEFMRDVNIWLTFESIPPMETEHEVDELGFLKDFKQWNERFTYWVVRNWDLPDGVTEEHWRIIRYLREFYSKRKNIPTVYELCKFNKIGIDELGELFPRGYRRGACRAAGLPFFS